MGWIGALAGSWVAGLVGWLTDFDARGAQLIRGAGWKLVVRWQEADGKLWQSLQLVGCKTLQIRFFLPVAQRISLRLSRKELQVF